MKPMTEAELLSRMEMHPLEDALAAVAEFLESHGYSDAGRELARRTAYATVHEYEAS